MLSFECIKNEKSVYFLLTSALCGCQSQLLTLSVQMFPATSENRDISAQNDCLLGKIASFSSI